MTRDDIIRMARGAGFETGTALCEVVVRHSNGSWVGINAELIEFASLVAAAERADCAAVCKDEAKQLADSADRLKARGSNYEARQLRGLAWKCIQLKEIIEDRGKP